MKTNRNPKLIRSLAAVVGGFALFTGALQAAPFLYTSGDLLLTFRKAGNASDFVVNIGKATNYNNLPLGTSFTVSNLTVAQLSTAFPDYNELKWSVAAANRPPFNPNFADNTVWTTRPRLAAGTQSAPWLRKGQFTQGTAAAQIEEIGTRSFNYSSSTASNANNTATGVLIPTGTAYELAPVIGSGNYNNTFQGNVETLTAADFDSDSANVSRADLYELIPATSTLNLPGRYLGYFELKPNGTVTFNNPVLTPPAPTITSIVRNGDVTTVSFTTSSGYTYRLRSATAAGLIAPVSTWAIGNSITGTGSVLSLSDTSTADIRFFAVEAQ